MTIRTVVRHSAYMLLVVCYIVIGLSGNPLHWWVFAGKNPQVSETTGARPPGSGGCKPVWAQYKHVAPSAKTDISGGWTASDAGYSDTNVEFVILPFLRCSCTRPPFLQQYNPRSPPAA